MSCFTVDRCCTAPCIDGGICTLPHSHGGAHYSDKEVLLDFINPARHEIAALKARAEKAEAERDQALAANVEMRAALGNLVALIQRDGLQPDPPDPNAAVRVDREIGRDWACRGCRPDSDVLKEGFLCSYHRARVILSRRPDLGAGMVVVPREMVERVRDAAIKCGDCVLCQGTAERHDDGCPITDLPW